MRLLVTALLFLSTTASAQHAPVRDAQALSVVRQFIAKSGAIPLSHLDTLSTGTITFAQDGRTLPITIKTSGTNYVQNSIGTEFVFTRAGNGGWIAVDGKRSALSYHQLQYKRADHIPSLLLLTEIEAPNTQCKLIGVESVAGQPAYHVRLAIVPPSASDAASEDLLTETHLWIDQATLLVTRTRTFDFSPQALQNRSPVDTYFSDYRPVGVGQFLVPFHVARDIAGQHDSDTTFTSMDVTVNFTPADFQ